MNAWDEMTNEELCLEYQKTKNDYLYEYFLKRNAGLICKYINPLIRAYPNQADDLEQAGRCAMWETMSKFDPTRANKFSVLFHMRIKAGITSVYSQTFTVRVPRYVLEHIEKYAEDHTRLIGKLSSLQNVVFTNEKGVDVTLEDVIESKEPGPEELALNTCRDETIVKWLNQLKPREALVLEMRYGLRTKEPMSLQRIGNYFGVTRERIRQIEFIAINKIRKLSKGEDISNVNKNRGPNYRPRDKKAINDETDNRFGPKPEKRGKPRPILHPETDKRFGPKPERSKPESKRSGLYVRKERPKSD